MAGISRRSCGEAPRAGRSACSGRTGTGVPACGRPDIGYAVSAVSRYICCFGLRHFEAVIHILYYLRSTRSPFLKFKRSPAGLLLECFVDSDWAGDVDGSRSQSGYIVMLGGNTVSCKSVLQRIVALSSMEAEFIAATEATKEILWIRRLLADMGYRQKDATTLWEDNRACICLSENPYSHARSKHIDVRYYWLRQHVQEFLTVRLRTISTVNQLADILTKNTGIGIFRTMRDAIFQETL